MIASARGFPASIKTEVVACTAGFADFSTIGSAIYSRGTLSMTALALVWPAGFCVTEVVSFIAASAACSTILCALWSCGTSAMVACTSVWRALVMGTLVVT